MPGDADFAECIASCVNSWQLTDFGVTRSLLVTRTMTSKIGTVQYMPPEALNGMVKAPSAIDKKHGSIDPATLDLAKAWDCYSFALLVAALFNRDDVPFPDLDERLLVVRVLMHDERPTLPIVLSRKFHKLLKRWWHQQASKRPTFGTILDEIDALKEPFNPSADLGRPSPRSGSISSLGSSRSSKLSVRAAPLSFRVSKARRNRAITTGAVIVTHHQGSQRSLDMLRSDGSSHQSVVAMPQGASSGSNSDIASEAGVDSHESHESDEDAGRAAV